jgi:hypothetical protein
VEETAVRSSGGVSSFGTGGLTINSNILVKEKKEEKTMEPLNNNIQMEKRINTTPQRLTRSQLIRSMLLFFGAFLFAFSLNSYLIHESGHALGGVLVGCQFESLQVNPFGTGGWVDQCPGTITLAGRFIRGMGGEIFGLPLSIAITLLLWRKRSPMLLPLLMSATVVCIGNVFSVLSITSYPGFIYDYGWALLVGIPSSILWAIGVASLVFGIVLMNMLIPLAGIEPIEPLWKVLVLNLSTWPLYLAVRLIYQSLIGINIAGPFSVFVFGIIVATLTALTYKLFYKLADRLTHTEPVLPSVGAVWLAIGLGVGLTGILVALNPAWFL